MTEKEKNEFVEVKGSDIWLPEKEGDMLEGVVLEITQGNYGTQLVVETADKKIMRTPSHKVLQSALPTITKGDQIRIVFEGEEAPKVKGNSPTKMYKVYKK